MSDQTLTPPGAATVRRLSSRFTALFETLETPEGLFTEDAFFDLNMPVWRFQIEGAEAFEDQLRTISQGPSSVDVHRVVPTQDGFVLEHTESQTTGDGVVSARRMWLCTVRDGRICHTVGYCSGEWDEDLRRRHAAEAPMLRP